MIASDTIAAIATPPGEGGIGIVRASGPDARRIAGAIFEPVRDGARLRSHRLVFGTLRDPRSGAVLDQGMACLMAAPRSYTGEDVVEFHCHGSPAVLARVLACCLAEGARQAQRGEFTLRAFLNGRLDLAQAEAVMRLVQARTATAAQVAAQAVTGALGRRIQPLVEAIVGTLAYLEATIDFTEEDLPEQEAPGLAASVRETRERLLAVLRRAHHGAVLRDGVRVVLAGKPNAGKSSLLNALLRRDRAIVTPIAGTTRDTLEEVVNIHGLPMFLVDTAGLNETGDPVERLGIARSTAALLTADVVALVVDSGHGPDDGDRRAAAAVRETAPAAPAVLVCTKSDLPGAVAPDAFAALASERWRPAAAVACSAVTGTGIDHLEDALARLALGGEALDAENTLVESQRQRQALQEAVDALAAAEAGLLRRGFPPEMVCVDLRAALEALGSITGANVSATVLDRIFADFCIGK